MAQRSLDRPQHPRQEDEVTSTWKGSGGEGDREQAGVQVPETWDEHLLSRVRSTAAQAAGQGAETRTGPDPPELAAATGRRPGDRGLGTDGNHGRR